VTNWGIFPCDRGIRGNVQARGYHNFQASPNGVVCCTYCGAFPEQRTSLTPSVRPPQTSVYVSGPEGEAARQARESESADG
jgi:hypothetical protein